MPISSLINAADFSKVGDGFRRIKTNNLPNSFLGNSNMFNNSINPSDVISKKSSSLTSDEVKEYMAVCTIVHCIDGWAYLNNSISSFLNGEPAIAIHLAYYVELRAAMSYLCSEGILIVNTNQVCIECNDSIYIPGKNGHQKLHKSGTHDATWNIIEKLVDNNTRDSNALEYFRYKGKSFKDLVQFIPHAPVSSSTQLVIVKDWLKSWCFDISQYREDKTGRNISSYNSNIKREYSPSFFSDRLSSINNFWRLLEPSGDTFSKLDQYLFSLYLTKVYDLYMASSQSTYDKNSFINDFFINSGLSYDSTLVNIFVNAKANQLITFANDSTIDTSGDVKPLSIIARSILLLRFCTGACSYFFRANNIKRSDLNFYLDGVGRDWGLWNVAQPDNFVNLWDDICSLLDDFDDYLSSNNPSNIYNVRQDFMEYEKHFFEYTQFSRACLWGLGL